MIAVLALLLAQAVADTAGPNRTLTTACSAGTSCAGTSAVEVALAGQQTVTATVTATSSPNGITLVADCSFDGGGANWLLTGTPSTTGFVQFVNNSGAVVSLLSPAVSSYTLVPLPGCLGATHYRVRVAALTSGSETLQLRAVASVPGWLNFVAGNPVATGAGATTTGTLRTVTANDVVPINTVGGPTAITAVCLDANINACGAGSTVSAAMAGQAGASTSWVNTNVTTTLVPDCQYGNLLWTAAAGFINTKTGLISPAFAYAADSTTTNNQAVLCGPGAIAARVRANAAVTNSTSVTVAATTGTSAFSLQAPFGGNAWGVGNQPAVSTQATVSRAATTNVKHVALSCSGSISAVAAQTNVYLNLRDGASGAGTLLLSKSCVAPVGTLCLVDIPIPYPGVPGSAGNAMTCEWSAAPVATNFATANLTGYDN